MCIPSFNILAIIQSHDTITYSTYVYHIWTFKLAQFERKLWHKFSLKRQKNGQIKGRIRASSPILNLTIQQLIVHVYTMFQDSSYNSSWENCDTKKSYGITELRDYGITNRPNPV